MSTSTSTFPVYTPSQWKSTQTSYYSIDVDNTLFGYQGASKSYSLSAPDTNTVRFELHDGDAAAWDVSVGHATERDEIASRADVAENGTPLEISYGFKLEPGAPNTANWMVLGQLHQNLADTTATGGPVFDISLQGENMSVVARYTTANGTLVQNTLWTDPLPIVRGQEYQMDIKVITDPTGQNGRLVVSRDGVTVADYSGALGDQNMTGVYWAEGIYRDAGATETVAADYSNLSIKTGSAVTFPPKSAFVAAPVLTVGAIDPVTGAAKPAVAALVKAAAAAPGHFHITLSGSTVPGGTIAVMENGQVVASGTANANGVATISVDASGLGTHAYYSVATDPSGRMSPTANAVDVVIGTAATIGGSLDALNADKNLGAIYVTDGQVLKVGTSTDLSRILHDTATLGKIQGATFLQASNAVTGKTYDTEVLTTTLGGTLVERQRYSAGTLTFDQVIAADGSSVTKSLNALGGYDSLSSAADNFTTGFSRYDAKGNLSYTQSFGRDGSSTTVNYDLTTGKETSFVQKNADKSSTSVTLNITGQAYTVQMLSYGKTGALVDQERYTATGTKVFSAVWNADGSHSVTSYDPKTGREINSVLTKADGSSVQMLFGITGKAYTEQTTTFDKSGKVLSVTTSNAVGDIPPASTFIMGLLANTANTTTTVAADGSKQVQTYQLGSATVLANVASYAASGALTERDAFDASGRSVSTDVFTAGAGDVLTTFDPTSGLVTGTVRTKADGTKTATTYQAGSSTLLASVSNYTATGVLSESETYDGTGRQIEINGYDGLGRETSSVQRFSDGSRSTTSYDGATGTVLQSSTVYADGSHTDVNNAITGKAYAAQSVSYNAAGKVLSLARYYGDAAHTLAMSQVINANGSSAVRSYDTLGREVSRTLTAADGSSEVVNSTYGGSALLPSSVQDYHYGTDSKLLSTDTTNANGTHTLVAAAAGVSLAAAGKGATLTSAAAGGDSFVFQPAFGQDMVTNFHAGSGANHDTIDLSGLHLAQSAGQSSMDVLAQTLHQVGRDVVLSITPADTVTLKNTALASLTSSNFKV